MPVMPLLLLASAQAGTAVWLEGTPDATATPNDRAVTVAEVTPADLFAEADQDAIRRLTEETAACLPLLDEFDGELAILQRIERALEPVELLRATDVDVVWKALLLQGLATHRYFPDPSSADAQGAGAALSVGNRAENRAWAHAIALLPDRMPTTSELADEAARLAFQEQRARAWLVPSSIVIVDDLPEEAVLRVDGRAQEPGVDRLSLVPGHHRISIELEGQVHQRLRLDTKSGETSSTVFLAHAASFGVLLERLSTATGPLTLPASVQARADTLDAPVSFVVPLKRGEAVFVVRNGQAVPAESAGRSRTSDTPEGARLHVGVGGGWVYDGDYLLQNHADGAPAETGTVNAGASVLHLSGQSPLGATPLHAGVGVDLALPFGEHHTLPSGTRQLRLRAYPHLALGAGPAALTVGWWTPWHLGVGVQGHLPIADDWRVSGGLTQGVGLTRPREGGPDFEPASARAAWLGVAWAFDG